MSFHVQSPIVAVLQPHVSACIANCSVIFSCKGQVAAVGKQVGKDVLIFLETRLVVIIFNGCYQRAQ